MKSIINSKDNKSLETKQENDSNFTLGTQPELNEHTTTGSQQINNFQRQYGNMATLKLYQEPMLAQTGLQSDQGRDSFEAEADQVAENTVDAREEQPRLTPIRPRIQRKPAGDNPAPTTSPPQATQTDPGAAATRPALIVEDTETELQPNQMRKSEFLSHLRTSVCAAAEAALAETVFSAMGCPWIYRWFGYYSGRNSQQIERAIQRYAPAAAGITSATDYIPIITSRVRSAIATWAETGEITGVPEGVPTGIPDAAEESPSSATGGVLFKGHEGRSTKITNPQQIQNQLGPGSPLESGVRSRMESVFTQGFSDIRIHTDTKGAQISDNLNARAFTIGSNIAFGQGEYQPGTLIGDALIAHELAHTIQQGGGRTGAAPMQKGEEGHSSLEEDADISAVGAVASLWGGMKGGLANIAMNAMPRMRSGLRLQACKSDREREMERLAALQKKFLKEKDRQAKIKKRKEERKKRIAAAKKAGKANPVEPPVDTSKVKGDPKSAIKKSVDKVTKPDAPTKPWDDEVAKDKGKSYLNKAKTAIQNVKTTAASQATSDPEKYAYIVYLLKRTKPTFTAKIAIETLKKKWFAVVDGSKFKVSMAWIDLAHSDPRNVFPNIAHEIGGHLYYGKEITGEVSDELFEDDKDLREKFRGTKKKTQNYYDAFVYPETEIFAELVERRYVEADATGFKPKSGTDVPDTDIPNRLKMLKKNWHPEIRKKVCEKLVAKARKHPSIRKKDLQFLLSQIKAELGYEFPGADK
ncbi:MAG: DUF4157 domain-containing protein [Deltaproteobacteria bacterium]|nr:DUF4157 domain-containing protein [Deltaproteobacteria bacterium]